MKLRNILSAYFFALLVMSNTLDANSTHINEPKLHLCTAAPSHSPGLDQLLVSCQHNGISLDVLGFGMASQGLAERLHLVKNYIKELPEGDVVMYLDADDVLILANADNILSKFFDANIPFLISAERYIWAYADRESEFPLSPTSFRYLNSGSYIGYVYYLKWILGELPSFNLGENDQTILTLDYITHPEKYTLDTSCQMFLPLAGVIKQDLIVDQQNIAVKCLETDSTPCLIHGNGGSLPLYQDIYNDLFVDNDNL